MPTSDSARSVLIVSGSPLRREIISWCSSRGIRVATAADLAFAAEYLSKTKFALIVLDELVQGDLAVPFLGEMTSRGTACPALIILRSANSTIDSFQTLAPLEAIPLQESVAPEELDACLLRLLGSSN